jgi:hypothetical protein
MVPQKARKVAKEEKVKKESQSKIWYLRRNMVFLVNYTHYKTPLFFFALGGSERIMGISIISYGKNSLDLRPTSVTTSPRERIEFVSQGSTILTLHCMNFQKHDQKTLHGKIHLETQQILH